MSFKDRFFYGLGGSLNKANPSEDDGLRVKNFGHGFAGDGCNIVGFATAGSKLYVMVDICEFDPASGVVQTDRQLWKSDGTKAGTKLVFSWAQAVTVDPQMTTVGGEVMFLAVDADGSEDIFRSNGTTAGTVLTDESPDWSASELSNVGDSLYFVKDDGVSGRELWRYVP